MELKKEMRLLRLSIAVGFSRRKKRSGSALKKKAPCHFFDRVLSGIHYVQELFLDQLAAALQSAEGSHLYKIHALRQI